MKTEVRVSVNPERSTPPTPAGRATRIDATGWLAAIQSLGLAVIVGWDGTTIWRAARVLAVIAITGLALIGTHRASRAGRGAAALALGVTGTVVGGGVASAELAKAGVTVIADSISAPW